MDASCSWEALAILGIFLVEMLSCFTACTYPVDYPCWTCSRGRDGKSLFIWGCRMQNKLASYSTWPKECLSVVQGVMVDTIIHNYHALYCSLFLNFR